MGEQYAGIDLHCRRSVIVRMTTAGEVLEIVRVATTQWRYRCHSRPDGSTCRLP